MPNDQSRHQGTDMTDHTTAAQAAGINPLSDEYVNAVIQQHGYQSPETVIARLSQWIGLHGGENGVTLLMYEAHKALVKLRAPVADERAAFERRFHIEPENWSAAGGGGYRNVWYEARWEGWKARAAMARAPVADEGVRTEALYLLREARALLPLFTTAEAIGDWSEKVERFAAGHAIDIPASAPVAGEAQRLDAPAQVGGTRFGKGIHWSTVIHAAQRHHQYMQDPAREAERIALAKEFRALVAGDAAPQASEAQCSCPSGDGSLRCPCAVHGAAVLNRDEQRLAVWQAIQAITIGNLHDDKLIVANLNAAGYVISRAALSAQPGAQKGGGERCELTVNCWT